MSSVARPVGSSNAPGSGDSVRGGSVAKPRAHRSRRRHTEMLWAFAFLAPAFLAILFLRIAPSVGAFVSSLYQGFPGGVREAEFAGFANYSDLFSTPAFVETLVRTIVFNLIINPLQVVLALLVAVVMTRRVPARGLWRTLVFIPATVPIVGSSIAWGVALRPKGPVNAIIEGLGGEAQPFFTSPDQALASIILVASWIGIGYWMLFLIAGLEAIPGEYYEAARIDRAGPIRQFFSITLPLLKRPLLFVLVANTVANFVLFVPIQLLTNGGPQSSTTLLMFDAYRQTFTFGSRNLGAAEVIILTLIMLFFVALQFRLLREDASTRNDS
jgi:ABC-type sugar transport system permease subunit